MENPKTWTDVHKAIEVGIKLHGELNAQGVIGGSLMKTIADQLVAPNLQEAYLKAYLEDLDVVYEDKNQAARFLCENYHFPKPNFKFIAYGWMWGRTGNSAAANAGCFILEKELMAMYEIVSKENNWGET